MGLIRTALNTVSGALADQWKEYFYCEALPTNILVAKGQKKVNGRSSNTKGDDNVISNGSIVSVADGQCMIIVEQGKVVELCAEPGEFKYDTSLSPSIFAGSLKDGLLGSIKEAWDRFQFGGMAGKDQRVYYFNTKEISGNKFGTATPIPFRVVVNEALGYKLSVDLRCNGEYSYRIINPMLFYTNVCGNVSSYYDRSTIDSTLKSELMNALQPALSKIAAKGIEYYEIPAHTVEICDALNEVLSSSWGEKRGIIVFSMSVNSLSIPDEQKKKITEWEENAMTINPATAGARIIGAQVEGIKNAASNPGGAAIGFMNMNMAQNAGGMNAANFYQMSNQQPAQPAPAADSWKCPKCGATVTGNFCPQCGEKKPAPQPAADSWKCPKCGAEATGKFCPECGTKKPEEVVGWKCPECGTINKGKFCMNCGAKKPAGEKLYKCDKCGWEPADPAHPPKFCPECGDPFDDNDVKE